MKGDTVWGYKALPFGDHVGDEAAQSRLQGGGPAAEG